jgi:hypothetical protein
MKSPNLSDLPEPSRRDVCMYVSELRARLMNDEQALRTTCATRRFIASPAEPGGIGGTFLDPMTHPDSKGNGKRSMPENR